MLQQLQLKRVPKDYQFEYMRSFQRLMDIRNSLNGFEPTTDAEKELLKARLAEYRQFFKRISDINSLVAEKN